MFGNLSTGEPGVITDYSLVFVAPFWQILKKAGYHPLVSLLAIVPFVNLVALYIFAFSKWLAQSR